MCEIIGRCLTQYAHSVELCSWICRVLGHLAKESEDRSEAIGSVGACETSVAALQRFQNSIVLATEVCWAIRYVYTAHCSTYY